MLLSILLPAILFVLGFINIICFYFPSKRLYAWLQSFFSNGSTGFFIPTKSEILMPKETNSDPRKEDLKRVFATFDRNGDGFITELELKESLKNLNMFITKKEAAEMVGRVDANGDGLIDLDEFSVLCESTLRREQEGERRGDKDGGSEGGEGDLKEAFDVFDKDKNGLISVEELGSVLSSLGLNEGRRMEDCKAMIRKVDADGDGMVNFDEFKRMMKGGVPFGSVF